MLDFRILTVAAHRMAAVFSAGSNIISCKANALFIKSDLSLACAICKSTGCFDIISNRNFRSLTDNATPSIGGCDIKSSPSATRIMAAIFSAWLRSGISMEPRLRQLRSLCQRTETKRVERAALEIGSSEVSRGISSARKSKPTYFGSRSRSA